MEIVQHEADVRGSHTSSRPRCRPFAAAGHAVGLRKLVVQVDGGVARRNSRAPAAAQRERVLGNDVRRQTRTLADRRGSRRSAQRQLSIAAFESDAREVISGTLRLMSRRNIRLEEQP